VKRILFFAAAALAFATAGHADELSDIQAQSKQLREQNQALTKRLADLERRQRKLETRSAAVARPTTPANAMAADYSSYKAEYKKAPPQDDSLTWHGITLYGLVDMGLTYQNHGTPLNSLAGAPINLSDLSQQQREVFWRWPERAELFVYRSKGKPGDCGWAIGRIQSSDAI
jgi:hypothetical protein